MIHYLNRSFKMIHKINKYWIIITIIIRVINGLFPLAELSILRSLVNEASKLIINDNGNIVFLIELILLEFAIQILKSASGNFINVIDTKMELDLDYNLGKLIMEKSVKSPYYYYEIPTFYNHLYRIKNNYGNRFLRPIKNILEALQIGISIVSYIGFLFFTHWGLVLMGVLVAIPTFIIQYKYGNSRFYLLKMQSGKVRETNYINTLFCDKQSTKEIRLFNLRDTLLKKWTDLILSNNRDVLKLLNKQRFASIGLDTFSALLYSFAAFLTVYIIKIKKISIGNFVIIVQSLKELQSSVNHMSIMLATILESSLYIKDFFEFLDYQESVIENKIDKNQERLEVDPTNFSKNISIQNLFYKYPIGQRYVLKNINLNIKAREKIAIVGDNGSGKTTLIKILVGLYNPTQGNILFGDKEIREIKEERLRENITVIFQDFVKFAYSVRENIAFSNMEKLKLHKDIEKVAKITGVDKLVSKLPEGYDTNLGKILPNSVDISGGEWQKIALSRALFKDSKIVILDEPTASLDPETELDIFNKFIELTQDKTAIYISHRMADRIIVMRNGEIVEVGSHDDLMKNKHIYFNMYQAQATWYQ
ncbi:MAG: ABC transporter ATP-binding protein [Bacillota bacterium]|nr:ABC transporter ATP-binding protein [Bacillota bacterium]